MSKFVVNVENQSKSETSGVKTPDAPAFGDYQKPKKRSKLFKIFGILAAALIGILLVGAIGGYFYWQTFKNTPQYSLALLIEAARNERQTEIDALVDTNAVVDDFMPQITEKAVELYGKGLPSQTIQRVAQVAAPVLPAVKERARAELPRVIREKTSGFASVPFTAIVLGADRYLDITRDGDAALIKSKIADRPLEVKMRRSGERWQIVGVRDDQLATRIAQKIGQEIIAVATRGGINKAGETIGIKNLQDLLKQAEDILK